MRMVFGLAALLVVSGIVIFIMANSAETVTTKGAQAKRDLGGITGRAPESATPGNTAGAGGAPPTTTGAGGNSSPAAPGGQAAPNNVSARTPVANITNREVRDIDKSAEFTVKPKGLLATVVHPGGYYDYYYGLQVGDLITDAGEITLEGQDVAMLYQMSQMKRELKIIRNGQRTVLQQKQ